MRENRGLSRPATPAAGWAARVTTKRLNEQVKRNQQRFPADFMFQLTADEKAEVVANCDHLARLKFSRTLPYAFTEHGAIQASNVLASAQAVEMGVYVVRAFVRLREVVATSRELAAKLDALEQKTALLSVHHDSLAAETIAMNGITKVSIKLAQPLAVDAYTTNRATGAFILIDDSTNNTVAAGMIS